MAKAKSLFPYIVLRPQEDGSYRPRFVPSAELRALGFDGADLLTPEGAWFTLDQVATYCKDLMLRVTSAKETGVKVRGPKVAKTRSVEALLNDWLAALRHKVKAGDMAEATLDSYEKSARAIIYQPETRGDAKARREREQAAAVLNQTLPDRPRELFATKPVSAIGKPELRDFFNYAREARGHHMADAMVGAISAAFTWGQESPDWRIKANPRIGMEFAQPPGRVMLIPLDQFHHFVAAADALDHPSIGDSFYLGLFTGQRQTDRLLLADKGLIDGRRHLVQSKTKVEVAIKEAPALTARLIAARARVAAIKLRRKTRPDTIVVNETTGLAFVDDTYRHWFSEARRGAVHGIVRFAETGDVRIADPGDVVMARAHGEGWLARVHNQVEWLLQPMPACADKRDQDLRDTCVILMFRAGVSIDDICEITGHSKSSAELIRKHYLGRNNLDRADAAIDKLAAFVAAQGAIG